MLVGVVGRHFNIFLKVAVETLVAVADLVALRLDVRENFSDFVLDDRIYFVVRGFDGGRNSELKFAGNFAFESFNVVNVMRDGEET